MISTPNKIFHNPFLFIALFVVTAMDAQQTKLDLGSATVVSVSSYTKLPNFIKSGKDQVITDNGFSDWAIHALGLPNTITFKSYDVQKDKSGATHTRYKEYVNNILVEGSMLITHSKAGQIEIINGDYFANLSPAFFAQISEQNALTNALKKINAVKYKWQNKEQEAAIRIVLNQPDFSYYPKGELVVVHKSNTDYSMENMRLAYKFNIYAEKPLSRAYVFVDAITGEVINQEQIIHTTDVLGTANTKYSGNVAMTSDNYTSGQYRLQETGRGNGIATFNLGNTTTYANTDFTNTSSTWDVSGPDQAASDAHWGAEATYDYYLGVHDRNSIDNAGFPLVSYVHYDVNFANAFWDGLEMTYGDGNIPDNGFLIMTALDVCGHEITHGLTSFTAGLNGGGIGEPDALNEGFSDIFGTTIEAYARPLQNDWIIGGDITCTPDGIPDHVGLRDMSHPSNLFQPNCYLGTGWDTAGEPHNNNGPCIWWYYLLCQGGSGTNDLGNSYDVSGITMAEARMIAFRGLTVYFTPSTSYTDARELTIQAAIDLYGVCSPEVIATTNAWHAAGVGDVIAPFPVVTYSATGYDTLCLEASPIELTGGIPASGTYSGTGVSGGIFNPETAGLGVHSVDYSFTDANGCTSTATQNIVVDNNASCTTGIDAFTISSGLTIYPNPNNGDFILSFNSFSKSDYKLELTNTLGQLVYEEIISDFTGTYKKPISIAGYGKGVYSISLINNESISVKKIVIY